MPAVEAKPPIMFPKLFNEIALKGKVAIAHRGKHTFVDKAERLQAAGAVAVIFVNDSDEHFRPAAPDSGVTINIPCVCLRKSDGEQLVSKLPANISIAPHQGLSKAEAVANTKKVRRVVEQKKSEIKKEQAVSSFCDWLPMSCRWSEELSQSSQA